MRLPQASYNGVLGIAAFDLDGTLLHGQTVCEMLAEPLGRSEQMRQFEACTTEEQIAEARREMASWYRGHSMHDLENHLRKARWAPGAMEGIRELRDAGVAVVILSVTWGFAVRSFAAQLGVRHSLGTELQPNGEITHCWGRTKAEFLRQLITSHGMSRDRVAAVGDSASDIPMLEEASLRFFVGPTAPPLENALHFPQADIQSIAARILTTWV